MHPANSVIFFTTMSGAGYGLLFCLIVGQLTGIISPEPVIGFAGFGVSLSLITAGLLSSTFHLGHPERAWRALTQWRSSWLSREGVAAVLTYIPTGIFALMWCIVGIDPTMMSATEIGIGGAAAALALFTVFCTSKIYASLKAIPAWHNHWVPIAYILFAGMSGMALLSVILHLSGHADQAVDTFAFALFMIGYFIKKSYWDHLERFPSDSTIGTATGLGHLGKVTQLDPPHSESNYLLDEMGFRVARKHASLLRKVALYGSFVIPALCFGLINAFYGPTIEGMIMAVIGVLVMAVGLYAERWLFFAEAKHVVTLYYGRD